MKIALFLFAFLCQSEAITHELHEIFQAQSLHGTDVSQDHQGEAIQAKISSFPAVVVGAMPEALITAIAAPHRFPGPESYSVKEVNLLILSGIKLESEMSEKGLTCNFDLSELKMSEEIDLPVRTVLELAIRAIKETLNRYYLEAKSKETIRIQINGLGEKNAALKNLSGTFTVGK
ncbi:MAG: hypothetical protein ACSHYF_00855 [Verrucomicrobiaceae bacterium]